MSKNYRSFPYISNIEKFVQTSLNVRMDDRYRQITPWIKATPGAYISSKSEPYGRIVLQSIANGNLNGKFHDQTWNYSFETLYSKDRSFRPLAGITKAEIEFKNRYGGVRKANFDWICHSLDDLEELSPYYFNVGKSILLEWGWNIGAEQLINYTKHTDVNLDTWFDIVYDKVQLSKGNYDAMIGIITNFKYTINEDLSYTCNTEILTQHSLFENISLSNQNTSTINGTSGNKEDKTASEKMNEKSNQTIMNYVKNDLDNVIKSKLASNATWHKDTDTKNDVAIYDDIGDGSGLNMYVTWGFVEDVIFKSAPNLYTDKDNKILEFNSGGIPIKSHAYLRTTDLNVCVLPIITDTDVDPSTVFGTVFSVDYSKEYYNGKLTHDTQESNNKTNKTAFVRNIYINVKYLKSKLLTIDNLFDSVASVFTGISNACGNVWDFKLNVSPDGNRVYVCDVQYVNSDDITNDIYVFNTRYDSKTKNLPSVVTSISIESSLSSEIALNVFYATNKSKNDTTVVNGINDTTKNAFYSNYKDAYAGIVVTKSSKYTPSSTDAISTSDSAYMPTSYKQYQGIDSAGFSDNLRKFLPVYAAYQDNKESYWFDSGMKKLINTNNSDGSFSSMTNALIPVKCKISTEGVSGIRIGDVFGSDCLANSFQGNKRGCFQIMELKHTISIDGWFTEFGGQYRVLGTNGKSKPKGSDNKTITLPVGVIPNTTPSTDSTDTTPTGESGTIPKGGSGELLIIGDSISYALFNHLGGTKKLQSTGKLIPNHNTKQKFYHDVKDSRSTTFGGHGVNSKAISGLTLQDIFTYEVQQDTVAGEWSKYSYISIMGGANRLSQDVNKLWGKYKEMLEYINSKKNKDAIIIVTSTLALRREISNPTTKKLNDNLIQWCNSNSAKYIDLNSKIFPNYQVNSKYMSSDGIHPTKAAHMIWINMLKQVMGIK